MAETGVRRGWVDVTEGEFAGWRAWPADPWDMHSGPFFMRQDDDGSILCAFRVAPKHINSQGSLHGGAMMTFADFVAFAISDPSEKEGTVTVTLNSQFLRAAYLGDLIEGRGEVLRAGRRLVFTAGTLSTGGQAIFNFSATMMRTTPG